jgi:hypothetical protein
MVAMTTIHTSSQTLTIVSQHARTDSTFSRKDFEFKGRDTDVQITLEEMQKHPTDEELTAAMALSQQMFRDLDLHTHKILEEIGEEAPWILTKKFDFTNTGDEIEVINHNLDASEYNYLKEKLNADKALVNITDWYNEALADKWNNMSDSRNHTKEDTAGRIHVLSIFKGTEESIIEDSKSGLDNSVDPELYRFNNNDRGRWARSWGQILSVSMPVKTKA